MRAVALCLALAACGRIGFDAVGDAKPVDGGMDAALATPALVRFATMSGTTATITVPVTIDAGHLVVVVVDSYTAGIDVASIADAPGNSYVSSGATAVANGTCEIWYAANSKPASTNVIVTLNGSSGSAVWLAEFSGIAAIAPLAAVARTSNGSEAGTVAGAPLATAMPNELVVAMVKLDNTGATGLASGDVFTALPVINGDDTAYDVAAQPGTYGPMWATRGPSTFCASTAAFKAAP